MKELRGNQGGTSHRTCPLVHPADSKKYGIPNKKNISTNACSEIVGALPGPEGIAKMCDHIQHIMGLTGPEHVGIGLDLCDAYYAARANKELPAQRDDCLKDHSDLILLTAELLRRGIREEDIARIMGWNFISNFCSVL